MVTGPVTVDSLFADQLAFQREALKAGTQIAIGVLVSLRHALDTGNMAVLEEACDTLMEVTTALVYVAADIMTLTGHADV